MEPGSGTRLARRWRLLLAHDATSATCDSLFDAIEGGLGNVDIYESSSVDDARDALRPGAFDPLSGRDGSARTGQAIRFDVCLVCLDLPPAPAGGVRLAQELLQMGLPVVLITRSLRWIPPSAAALRELPWITPDASEGDVARAVGEAVASFGIVADASWPAAVQAGGE